MRLAAVLPLFVLIGCGAPPDGALVDDATDFDGKADGARPPPGLTFRLSLDFNAFPLEAGRPSALVYAPAGFDPTPPVDVIVYLHGFYNCVDNIVRTVGKPCRAGTAARQAYGLLGQLEASKRNALFIAPEVAFDRASSDPGRLGEDGALHDLLAEALPKLESLGPLSVDDVGRVAVASHSGGYKAAAKLATVGGLPVSEIWLLDSLYGVTDEFDAWTAEDLTSFADATRRMAIVYSYAGGTLKNTQAMADRVSTWLDERDALVDDRSTATLSDEKLARGLLFKRSALSHESIPRYYFGKLAASSGLAAKP